MNVLDTDPYDRISEKSTTRKMTKAAFATHFKVSLTDIRCMVSGLQPASNDHLILAHILPRSADIKTKESLAIDDIDCIRNFLILCTGFQRAFDSKSISFIPADNPFANNMYKLKIWTATVRNATVFEGSTQTIGEYENQPLNLQVGTSVQNPYKRLTHIKHTVHL